MARALFASLLSLALITASAQAQDGPLRRAGRALDQTGKNIRSSVETEVARGQVTAQERDILNRVSKRIDWDKLMAGSTLRLEAQAGGVILLQGSVLSPAAKARAVDLAENTTGVTSVIDQLAVVQATSVIDARTAAPAVEVSTPGSAPIVVPPGSKVIVKP